MGRRWTGWAGLNPVVVRRSLPGLVASGKVTEQDGSYRLPDPGLSGGV